MLPFFLAGALERVDPVTLTWARFVIASGALYAWLALRGELPALRKLAAGGWRLLALAVLGLAANYIAYLVGLQRTTPAGAQVLIQLAQVLLSLGALFVFGERFSRVQWAGFGALLVGLVTFSWAQIAQLASEFDRYLSGVALIVFASITWAGYGLAQKQLLVRLGAQPLMLLIYLGCALCFTPFAAPRALLALDAHGWALVAFCGANTLLGYGALAAALAHWEIPLAATPDPQSAAPISGAVDECKAVFEVEMKVSRIFESPRVTKPYTPEQWAAILHLGEEVDARLSQGDCRLTMGGEPTFVSVDDPDGPEWNTLALGPKKRVLGDQLIKRLKQQFTSGALLHYGQGKWYPGESLPRWSFAAYWRRDGHPIWTRETLFADESRNYGYGTSEAERFMEALSEALGCGTGFILPAYQHF